jgi:hypothetical protein
MLAIAFVEAFDNCNIKLIANPKVALAIVSLTAFVNDLVACIVLGLGISPSSLLSLKLVEA